MIVHFTFLMIGAFCVSLVFTGSSVEADHDTQEESLQPNTWTTWGLPSTAQFGRLKLTISPHQRWICFFRKTRQDEKPGLFRGVGNYVMVDTRTGAETRVEDLFKEGRISGLGSSTGELQFSPSGKYVLVHAAEPMWRLWTGKMSSLFLVNLDSKEATKLASDTFVLGRWMGKSVVVASMDRKRLNPVKIVGTENTETKELSACGLVVACNPVGRFMIMLGDPKSLGKPARIKKSTANHLLAVNLESKIIKDFGLFDGIPKEIILSPAGKYLMYKTYETPKPFGGKGKIRVVSVRDDRDRTIETAAVPVAVSDNGTAIIAEGGLEGLLAGLGEGEHRRDLSYVVTRWDVAGDMTTVLEGKSIIELLAVGERLFYVTASKKGTAGVAFASLDALFENGNNPKE